MARQRTFLSDSSNIYLQCRDLMHAWKWVSDFAPVKGEGRKIVAMSRTLICMRCGTVRTDEYSVPSMVKIRASYTYPEDSRIKGQKGQIPVSDVRQEIITRIKRKEW